MEKWEPCTWCKSCDTCKHDTYIEKDRALCKLCYKHEYYEPRFNYCHICGRPLTKEAREELCVVLNGKDKRNKTIRGKKSWISIEDYLPSVKERVLCFYKFEPYSPNIICKNRYLGGGIWENETDKITH